MNSKCHNCGGEVQDNNCVSCGGMTKARLKKEIAEAVRNGKPFYYKGLGLQLHQPRLPWWRTDRLGWPIETVKGKWIQNGLRIVMQNIRKVVG